MNPLEMLKKGMSALNPLGSSVDKKAKVGKNNPIKPVVEKSSGYLGDSARKVSKRNKALEEAAKEQ